MERGVGVSGKTGKVAIRKNKARKKVSSDDFDLSDEELLAQQQLQQQPNSQQQQQQLQQVYSQQQSQQQQQQQQQSQPPQQQIPVTGPGGGKKKGGKKRKEKIMSGGPRGGINVSKKGKQHGMMSSSQVGLMNEVQKDTGYYSAGQNKINDMMRRALEDEQYSALGSIVDTDSSDDESTFPMGSRYGIDRNAIMEGFRQNLRLERENELGSLILPSIRENNFQRTLRSDETGSSLSSLTGSNKGKGQSVEPYGPKQDEGDIPDDDGVEEQEDEEESSMFGQSSGSNNATWVECDKCKKWRRLRGSVDAKKLPPKWFCSMNKNDPEHAKCSAPEEEYNENNTPESATDHRIRKHLRLWVRRLQSNEAYEQKLPTMTRGKKKSVTTNSKEPYEWVRCANPSCGKFRAILRFMDASTICDNARNGEWYCVLNTWDEKMASCAAPQENLPASGCPPWVLQDE